MQKHLKGASKIPLDIYKEVADLNKFVTIVAYNVENDRISDLCKATEESKGLETIVEAYEKARRIKASYILVYELKNPKSPVSKPSAKYQIDVVNLLEKVDTEEKEVQPNFQMPDYSRYNEDFQGLGGLQGLIQTKEELYKKDFEVQTLTYENKQLVYENTQLKKELEDYEKENADLEEANLKLINELEPYRAKDPNRAKIFGIGVSDLLGHAVERGAKNLFINNPKLTKTVFGLDDTQLSGFISELNGTAQPAERNIDTNMATDVQFDDDVPQNLSPEQKAHLQVSQQIFEWLKTISSDDLYKTAKLLEVFQKDMSLLDQVLEFTKTIKQ